MPPTRNSSKAVAAGKAILDRKAAEMNPEEGREKKKKKVNYYNLTIFLVSFAFLLSPTRGAIRLSTVCTVLDMECSKERGTHQNARKS